MTVGNDSHDQGSGASEVASTEARSPDGAPRGEADRWAALTERMGTAAPSAGEEEAPAAATPSAPRPRRRRARAGRGRLGVAVAAAILVAGLARLAPTLVETRDERPSRVGAAKRAPRVERPESPAGGWAERSVGERDRANAPRRAGGVRRPTRPGPVERTPRRAPEGRGGPTTAASDRSSAPPSLPEATVGAPAPAESAPPTPEPSAAPEGDPPGLADGSRTSTEFGLEAIR